MSKQQDTDAYHRWCQVMDHGMAITHWHNLHEALRASDGKNYIGVPPLSLTPQEAHRKQDADNEQGKKVGIRYLYLKVGEQPDQPKLNIVARPIEVPKDTRGLTYSQGRFA